MEAVVAEVKAGGAVVAEVEAGRVVVAEVEVGGAVVAEVEGLAIEEARRNNTTHHRL